MMRQYLEVKAQYPDAILLYRMGDFFEIFSEDARRAAPILEVALTARQKGTANEVAMCGVPHHAIEGYLGKLLRAGLKVAICDQVEDPKQAKGLVKREVTRVVTPGTVSSPELLEGKEDNLLASLIWQPGGPGTEQGGAGAFLDVSTGTFFVRRWPTTDACLEDLGVLRPREVLFRQVALPAKLSSWIEREVVCWTALEEDQLLDSKQAGELLQRQLETSTLRGFGLHPAEAAVLAAATALSYAQQTQHSELSHIRSLQVRDRDAGMVLDPTTLSNLEVFRSLREGGRSGTLLSVLDQSVSPPGGRLLRDWLRRPLKDPAQIELRLDAVGELIADGRRREGLREELARVGDLERLLGRAVLASLTPREAGALRDGLLRAPALLARVAAATAELLATAARVDPLADLAAELDRLVVESPPAHLRDGGVIAAGVDEELDRCRSLARDSKQHILAMEARERQATGIGSLKIRYNKVFGYYLEVTKANQHLVPEHYIRKQTLVNAERYITPEVKELEEQVLSAEERQLALEERYFEQVRQRVVVAGQGLRDLAAAFALLDTLAAFAEVGARRGYCRPKIRPAGGLLQIREGRHPVVERSTSEPFVPNDAELGEDCQIVVLTGPNMGGKSTYLRQVALIVLMAQAGSFVPAEAAEISTIDRLFTRVGAADDLARGESTFMVEMIETANILHHATGESLVILDEVGRGTATFDGLSLAWAIVEHLHQHRRPKTLFATHYHELTELASTLPGVVNRTMAVREWEERIIFLRRVVPGSADKSYGIHVARLAGLPDSVITRAAEVLANLEAQEYDLVGQPRLAQGDNAPVSNADPQLSLFTPVQEVIAELLREVDLNQLTPLAALNFLHGLKDRLG